MHPYAETDVVTKLRDEFDGVHAWRGYWSLRFADDDNPGNDDAGFFNSKPFVPTNEWDIVADGLKHPTYDWLETASTEKLGMMLTVKVKTFEPPFRFDVVLNYPVIEEPVDPRLSPGLDVVGYPLGFTVPRTIQQRISWFTYLFNENTTFNVGAFQLGKDIHSWIEVDAGLNATWDLTVDGVRPPYGFSSWEPGVTRHYPNDATNHFWLDTLRNVYGKYSTIRMYPTFGGTLRYLELTNKQP